MALFFYKSSKGGSILVLMVFVNSACLEMWYSGISYLTVYLLITQLLLRMVSVAN